MPKTSLLLVRTPKKVLCGVFRLTFVAVVFWSMCLPSVLSRLMVSFFAEYSFTRFMRTAKLSPSFRAFLKFVALAAWMMLLSLA